jgi:hypothetical protein
MKSMLALATICYYTLDVCMYVHTFLLHVHMYVYICMYVHIYIILFTSKICTYINTLCTLLIIILHHIYMPYLEPSRKFPDASSLH